MAPAVAPLLGEPDRLFKLGLAQLGAQDRQVGTGHCYVAEGIAVGREDAVGEVLMGTLNFDVVNRPPDDFAATPNRT